MKKYVLPYLFFLAITCCTVVSFGQPPSPPSSPDGGPVEDGNGSLGSGLVIMLTLAGGYAAKKVYNARNKLLD